MRNALRAALGAVEWPTVALILLTYAAWWGALHLPVGLAVGTIAVIAALHGSLTHEVVHGHPTRWSWVNAALVFPVLPLTVPYLRFRDTHLAHHCDSRLTDPYEDPESNYLDPAVWRAMSRWLQALHRFNNTLLGRMLVGPALGQIRFMRADWDAIRGGDRQALLGWLLHVPSVVFVLVLVSLTPLPLWAYLVAAYGANSLLRIRTFLEHQSHEKARGRTVIIEDRGPLAFLFLNNNLHVVHHIHPKVPWYGLPAVYRANRARYLRHNEGYCFASYGAVFLKFGLRRKDPVPHPLYEDWTSQR